MPTDVRGRSSRERLVHHVATPETIRNRDSETITRLFERGFLRGEHVIAWEEISEAWSALSRGLGIRLMRFAERSDGGVSELSDQQERFIRRMSKWSRALESAGRLLEYEIIIATVMGHPLRDIAGVTSGPKFDRTKELLQNGLTEYCLMNGMLDRRNSR